jgi:KDO2-lipid IV(A) lauroyltransferase
MALRDRAPYVAYRSAATVAQLMPGPMASVAARGVGVAFAQAMRGRRSTVASHLRRIHGPHLTGAALEQEVQRAFDSYARYWMEAFRLPSMSRAEIDAGLSYAGLNHVRRGVALGRGVIMALPHMGNWDFGGAWLALQGFDVAAVAEVLEPPELFEWFVSYRRRLNMEIIPLGPSAGADVLRALRAGKVVGLISDRDLTGGGVPVELFGETTTLPGGPATLALRTGAPLLPAAIYMEPHGHHHGVVRPPIPIERTGRLRDDVVRVTQLLARELEELIRRAPEQWHNFQPTWPSDPGYTGRSSVDGDQGVGETGDRG